MVLYKVTFFYISLVNMNNEKYFWHLLSFNIY